MAREPLERARVVLGVKALTGTKASHPWGLLELAQNTVPESRYALATSITDLYAERAADLSERESRLIDDILDRLVRAFERDLRLTLAERLARRAQAPHALIMTLACDDIEIARPVLQDSLTLENADLIEIIERYGEAHQLAIAERQPLDDSVSDALVATQNVVVIEALLRNRDARLTEVTLQHLVEEARWVESYRRPLLHRNDLSVELARRLYGFVSVALRQYILSHFDIDAEELEQELGAAIAERFGPTSAPAPDAEGAPSEGPLPAIHVQLAGSEQISPQLLIRVLRKGDLQLFESLLGELACLSKDRISVILSYCGSSRAFAVVCRALAFAKPDFAVMLFLSRRLQGLGPSDDPRSIARMIEYFGELDPERSMAALRRWRRDPGYRTEIEALELNGAPQSH